MVLSSSITVEWLRDPRDVSEVRLRASSNPGRAEDGEFCHGKGRNTQVTANQDRNQLALYLLLALVFSSVFYCLILKSGHIASADGLYVVGLMWSPAMAAMAACKSFGQTLDRLGWKWGETRYQVISYFTPLAYAAIAYLAVWLFHLGGFYDHDFIARTAQKFGLGKMPQWATIAMYFVLSA